MVIKSKNLILLTGAGFTRNFGGFLGSEMFSKIHNDALIQKHDRLRKLMTLDLNFESVFSKVTRGTEFAEEEKQAMIAATEKAYKNLDDAIRGWVMNDSNPSSINMYNNGGLGSLLQLFLGSHSEAGLIFTLNQDLFLERRNGYLSPGVPRFPHEFQSLSQREFLDAYRVVIPTEDVENKVEKEIKQNGSTFHYIKLHGSFGWRSASGKHMVIGTNKEEDIASEPLLKCYFDLFQSAIKEGNKKIMIIGYGFQDQHINKIIWNGAKNHGLKVYIISPTPQQNFEPGGYIIDSYQLKDAIRGYYPYHLKEIFPPNQETTVHWREIKEALLTD